jgi:hypothetical protein
MRDLLRIALFGGGMACLILIFALGVAQHPVALLAPAHMLTLALAMVLYLLPTALALHRNCEHIGWIAVLNILTGWTGVGWVVALGWAAGAHKHPLIPLPARHRIIPRHL